MMNNQRMFMGVVAVIASLSMPLMLSAAEVSSLVQACSACHGSKGISPSGIWPNLAGQKKEYLAMQLRAYRDSSRQNLQMEPMAANLSDSDINKLSTYYSELPPPEAALEETQGLGGHVRARCISCHGREGQTVNSEWPNLAGQKFEYLQQQLLNYKSGSRENLIMQVIASELSNEEIAAVAKYFSEE